MLNGGAPRFDTMPGVGDHIVVVGADKGFGMATLHGVCACVLRGELTLERMQQLRVHSQTVQDRWGERRTNITVVESSAVTDVPRGVRVASGAMMRDFPSETNVTIIEGRGFRNSAARAILAAMMLLAGKRVSNRVFDDIRSAASWLVPRVRAEPGAAPISADDLVALVEKARSLIPA